VFYIETQNTSRTDRTRNKLNQTTETIYSLHLSWRTQQTHIKRPDTNKQISTFGKLRTWNCRALSSESVRRLGWGAAAEQLPDALLHLVTLTVSHPSSNGCPWAWASNWWKQWKTKPEATELLLEPWADEQAKAECANHQHSWHPILYI